MDPTFALVAFDFDHTILDGNSDWVVQELGEIPPEMRTGSPEVGWTEFMDKVFIHLRKNHGVTKDQLLKRVVDVPLSPGMRELLSYLESLSPALQAFIVSDANTEFVDVILREHKLTRLFPNTNIFTNVAYVDEAGGLRVKPFLQPNADGTRTHNCPLCPPNMCKGDILEQLKRDRARSGMRTERIFYVGDGRNDFCPSLRLSSNDIVCCRVGYKLEKDLKKELEKNPGDNRLSAKVLFFSDAKDVMTEIKTSLAK